jgi:SOS-response transcriptional repressor LexA
MMLEVRMPKPNWMRRKRRGNLVRKEILEFIKSYTNEMGYPPTQREIAAHIGRSTVTTYFHMQKLMEDGLLTAQIANGKKVTRTYKVV